MLAITSYETFIILLGFVWGASLTLGLIFLFRSILPSELRITWKNALDLTQRATDLYNEAAKRFEDAAKKYEKAQILFADCKRLLSSLGKNVD